MVFIFLTNYDVSIVKLTLSLYSIQIKNTNVVNVHFYNLAKLNYVGMAVATIVAFFKLT